MTTSTPVKHDYERIPYLVAFQNNSGVRDVYGGLAEIVVLESYLLKPKDNPSDTVLMFMHPIGGGAYLPMVLNKKPTSPSGVQFASAIVPPARVTRTSSAAARSWSGANMTPKVLSVVSNAPPGQGSRSASPSVKVTVMCSASARSRP